jgi:hypothetical protein
MEYSLLPNDFEKRKKNPFFSGEEKKMQRVVPFSPVNHKH